MYVLAINFVLWVLLLQDVQAKLVLDLTTTTFDGFISSRSMVMVEFYAPWCEICQELEPVYEGIASGLDESKDISLARVDCVAQPSICAEYGTPIYPTLRLFQGLGYQTIYNGARTSEGMIPYMERRYNPPVMVLSKADIPDFKANNEITIIGFWDVGDQTSNSTFTRVAQEHLDYYAFAATTDETAANAAGLERPGVALYKHYDDEQMLHQGNFEEDDIADFITLGSIPLVGEYTQKWAWTYFGEGTLPFVGLFADTFAERAFFAQTVMPTALDTQGTLRFATIDMTKHKKLAERFLIETGRASTLAIKDHDDQLYHFPKDIVVTDRTVADWIQAYQRGELKPYTKAQSTPEDVVQGHDLVQVVNAQNFEEVVLDDTADVLLEFYAPWCGHCKRFAPTYTMLAQYLAKPDSKIRIAKLDSTEHKIPGHVVTKFPTLQLFPAGAKDNPITYSGDRSLQDLISFLQTNGLGKNISLGQSGHNRGESLEITLLRDEL